MKIIADSAIPFLRGVLEPFAEVEYLPGTAISAADVRNADALVIRTRTRCDEKLLADSRVKLIATATIGFDHIDTAWCAAHGIEVTTAAGCNARGVLQWVGAALVHLSRTQGWQPAERTLGIVGVGHVGSLVKAYAEGWGFRVVCHTPLDASTRHMADSRLFGLMKPGAILLNSSRGEVVDGEALLRSGLGWALDVWEHEPHLDPALLENALLATPHIAGYSEQGKANATAMSVASLARRFGLPLEGWYPPQAAPARRRPISWQELCRTIGGAYDIASESRSLKERPGDFESMRDHYAYRREYF